MGKLRILLYFLAEMQAPDSNMRRLQTCFNYAFSITSRTALRFLTISAVFAAGVFIAKNGKISDYRYVNSLN